MGVDHKVQSVAVFWEELAVLCEAALCTTRLAGESNKETAHSVLLVQGTGAGLGVEGGLGVILAVGLTLYSYIPLTS